ncbi:endonuclease V [Actinoalloteichus hymeniacidonis]|uniref:Endonuclease V n=1 Tax=Actinoalloteichus hymeniacidonis TaxID=340345 RepID=A0AAC9HQI7_9PSEU|nr:endonuclease V [Actinoalloteichus hymeniacidonis]AOS63461.1 Endonuclease V [Actinoalloteichus hymeniacidonis]MBB5908497.1 deoxyribonuclease V [Actinoalloteichus hymeniacidonis]
MLKIRDLHSWPSTESEAVAIQQRLRPLVRVETPTATPRTAAGLDVAYRDGDALVAVVTVLDIATLAVLDSVVLRSTTTFPYVPGLFAFREAPALLRALERLTVLPDVLLCDGQGLAHPRRFGLACHLGVLTELPSIGVGKTPMGPFDAPEDVRGAWTPLALDNDVVGRALRTQAGVKPVFVSVGHRYDLDAACALVLRLAPRYRLPETTRTADHLGRIN